MLSYAYATSGKLFCTNHKEHKIIVLNADLTHSNSFSSDLLTDPSCLAMDTKGMVYACSCRFQLWCGIQVHTRRKEAILLLYHSLRYKQSEIFLGIFGSTGIPKFTPTGV